MRTRPLLAVLGLALALVLSGSADADRTVTEIDWAATQPLSDVQRTTGGPEGRYAAYVKSAGGSVTTHRLLVLEHPGVAAPGYTVTGQIRYEGVAGKGYVEMWSVFADGGRYFSRTLAPEGPLEAIRGDSDWREFQLPFFLKGAQAPIRLELDVVLPGAGTVWLGPLRLVQLDQPNLLTPREVWWGDATAGWVGAAIGVVLGCFGALVGTLCSLGRGGGFVFGALRVAMVAGLLTAALGVYAWLASQPWAVWYPLLLGGALSAGVAKCTLPSVRQRFEQLELQKIGAPERGVDFNPF